MKDQTTNPSRMIKTEHGALFSPMSLFMRVDCGTASGKAEDGETHRYELATSMTGFPIIRNDTTGNWFALDWQAVLRLARLAGIDKPFPPESTAPAEPTSEPAAA